MMLPPEIEDQYTKEVLYNTSLKDLPDEEWKLIDGFENYAVSNYGRVKSLARWSNSPKGNERELPDLVMKLVFSKNFNQHTNHYFYNVFCSLTVERKRYRRSVSRLVYHHFVEKFDLSDRHFIISYKDKNSLHTHYKNLEKISNYEKAIKSMQNNRAEISEMKFQKPISQYTIEGEWIADFENATAAEKLTGVAYRKILSVAKRKRTTAGGFLWFLKNDIPDKENFVVDSKSSTLKNLFNKPLWERLGRPSIDLNSLPACMNLSIEDLPGEEWKPIPNFEHLYLISNKGRVKRLGSWTSNKRAFWKEQIMRIMAEVKSPEKCYFYVIPNINGKKSTITIPRIMYYCFVKEFNLNDRTLSVINQNKPLWDMDPSKLLLHSIHLGLKKK